MTDEERQRTMDFILQQQAQFTADIQRLEESDRRADRRLTRLESVVKLVIRAGLRERRVLRQERKEREEERKEERREWGERINALIEAQVATEEIVRRNSENIDKLFAITQRTAESVDRLSRRVEQDAGGQNGGNAVEGGEG